MKGKTSNPTPRLHSILLEFIRLYFKYFAGGRNGTDGGSREGETAIKFESALPSADGVLIALRTLDAAPILGGIRSVVFCTLDFS
ncbi:hypothetical protein MHH28_14630 [Paenibacillus sp. FSL K6-1217]|uniref:hypothetical protein n=1 Tax=Paenibacillus sp. FSL K6-1217 TaxID=2921466 RepID=UPI003255CEF6